MGLCRGEHFRVEVTGISTPRAGPFNPVSRFSFVVENPVGHMASPKPTTVCQAWEFSRLKLPGQSKGFTWDLAAVSSITFQQERRSSRKPPLACSGQQFVFLVLAEVCGSVVLVKATAWAEIFCSGGKPYSLFVYQVQIEAGQYCAPVLVSPQSRFLLASVLSDPGCTSRFYKAQQTPLSW